MGSQTGICLISYALAVCFCDEPSLSVHQIVFVLTVNTVLLSLFKRMGTGQMGYVGAMHRKSRRQDPLLLSRAASLPQSQSEAVGLPSCNQTFSGMLGSSIYFSHHYFLISSIHLSCSSIGFCPILSDPINPSYSYSFIPFHIMSYIITYPIISLSYHIISYPIHILILSYYFLSYPILFIPVHPALFYPYPILSYSILSYCLISSPNLSY